MVLSKRLPQLGDTRYKVKFAWLPKTVGIGTRIWLERYISVQKFDEVTKYDGYGMACAEYKKKEWVEYRTSIWAGNNHTLFLNR
jgi:hypothetical protein